MALLLFILTFASRRIFRIQSSCAAFVAVVGVEWMGRSSKFIVKVSSSKGSDPTVSC